MITRTCEGQKNITLFVKMEYEAAVHVVAKTWRHVLDFNSDSAVCLCTNSSTWWWRQRRSPKRWSIEMSRWLFAGYEFGTVWSSSSSLFPILGFSPFAFYSPMTSLSNYVPALLLFFHYSLLILSQSIFCFFCLLHFSFFLFCFLSSFDVFLSVIPTL